MLPCGSIDNMKSKVSILLIIFSLGLIRLSYDQYWQKDLNIATYDALGYYLYLPATFIYKDIKKYDWLAELDAKYQMTGGHFYQASKLDNGNYTMKYFGGVAILQAPFFAVAHWLSPLVGYDQDGFSYPYQLALLLASLFYSILAMVLLRWLLLQYFDDRVTAMTLLLVVLASNVPQYMVVDCGQTHSYLFFIYAVMLVVTKKWYDRPTLGYALLIGMLAGLAVAIRPTEAIIVLIPILWIWSNNNESISKWQLAKRYPRHMCIAALAGILMIVPQLMYWKITTGHYVHDVGSKWTFADPFFRVLFGWEKGWFVYTPVTILFVMSLWFVKSRTFRFSLWVFMFLNIWIVISWFDWRYGGSYSTRALSHSYPVFALSMASMIAIVDRSKWRPIFYIGSVILVVINVFQIWQYNVGIIDSKEMNRQYYQAIFMDADPEPLDYSLLHTQDWIDQDEYISQQLDVATMTIEEPLTSNQIFAQAENLPKAIIGLKTQVKIKVDGGFYESAIVAEIVSDGLVIKKQEFPLSTRGSIDLAMNEYEFYTIIPTYCIDCQLRYRVAGPSDKSFTIGPMQVMQYHN